MIKNIKNAARPKSDNYNHIKSNHTSIKSKIILVSKQKAMCQTQSAHLYVVSQSYSH